MATHRASNHMHHTTIPVMAHLVLGFPDLEESLRTAETYIRAGVQVLELQIPFSHPTADGPVITAACRAAVRQGVSLQDCMEAIRRLREQYPEQEIIVMSYLNRVYSFGSQKFVEEMKGLGVRHLIIPDLPVDEKEWMFETVKLVPVLAANVSGARLEKLLNMGLDFFYLMSDFKITGGKFSLHPHLKEVISKIKSDRRSPRIGIGFGISTPEQARLVTEEADMAIIGSALINAQREGRLNAYLEQLHEVFEVAGNLNA